MEVEIRVTLQVDQDDPTASFHPDQIRKTAVEAVRNALQFVEANGFSHSLASDVSIGLRDVEAVDSDMQRMMQAESEIQAAMQRFDETATPEEKAEWKAIAEANPQGD